MFSLVGADNIRPYDDVYTRIPLALFHRPWYNVRSYKTRRLFMKQFAAQFYFGYYYFFEVKK